MMTETTVFLNVDFDVIGEGIEEWLSYTATFASVLNQTQTSASLEIKSSHASIEEAILEFLESMKSLPQEAQDLWKHFDSRVLDIGIQAGLQPHSTIFVLPEETTRLVAEAGLAIRFTVYGSSADLV